jgi:hypothetical protein
MKTMSGRMREGVTPERGSHPSSQNRTDWTKSRPRPTMSSAGLLAFVELHGGDDEDVVESGQVDGWGGLDGLVDSEVASDHLGDASDGEAFGESFADAAGE